MRPEPATEQRVAWLGEETHITRRRRFALGFGASSVIHDRPSTPRLVFGQYAIGRGVGPRRRPRMSRRAPCSRCRRQFAKCELYKPSRRSSAPSSPGRLHASVCLRMRSRYSAVNRRRWAFAGTSGSGAVAADVAVGPKAPVALRAPSAFGPTTTSISTAGGMRFIHQTLPAPTLISIRRLSHRSLAQGVRRDTPDGAARGDRKNS